MLLPIPPPARDGRRAAALSGRRRMRAGVRRWRALRWDECLRRTGAAVRFRFERWRQAAGHGVMVGLRDWVLAVFPGRLTVETDAGETFFRFWLADRPRQFVVEVSGDFARGAIRFLLYPLRHTTHLRFTIGDSDAAVAVVDQMPDHDAVWVKLDAENSIGPIDLLFTRQLVRRVDGLTFCGVDDDDGQTFFHGLRSSPPFWRRGGCLRVVLRTLLGLEVAADEPLTPPRL